MRYVISSTHQNQQKKLFIFNRELADYNQAPLLYYFYQPSAKTAYLINSPSTSASKIDPFSFIE